ncbi:MAG TPA: YbfB/YjiJ family MFS transporter [Noviherbaspirillum sp.]|nr:YbfB/YjiJ family MFS transporter [Noviherbaspirillum sp.]
MSSFASTSSRNPWPGTLAGLAALAVAMGIGRFAFTPVLPMMLEERLLTIAAGAWLASANYLGYLLGAVSAMFVQASAERAIRISLVVIVASTCAMALHLPIVAWAGLRLLAGIASAWVLISVSAWAMDWVLRHQRPFLSSVVFCGVGTGIAAAGLLGIAIQSAAHGSSAAWLALGAVAMVVTAAIWNRFGASEARAKGARPVLRWNAQSLRLVAAYGLFGFGYIIPATFLPVQAKAALQGSAAFAWSWPVFGLAAALSTLTVAMWVRRIGNRRLWLACQLIMAVGVILPVASASLAAILGASLAVGGTFMVITAAALQEARQTAGPQATGLLAAMTAAFATGQMLGPLTIGSQGSFDIPLAVAAAALVAGALLIVRPTRTETLQPQE